MNIENLLTPQDVCDILKISRKTLQRMTQRKQIPHVLVSQSIRYTQQNVQRLIDSGGVEEYIVGQSSYWMPNADQPEPLEFTELLNRDYSDSEDKDDS